MAAKLLKYIPFTTAIIIYLYCCGGLYLIGYWEIFKIDITGFISISEIPKYFVFPFFLSNVLFILIMVIILLFLRLKPVKENANKTVYIPKKVFVLSKILGPDILFIILVIQSYWVYEKMKLDILYWRAIPSLMIYLLSVEFGKSTFLADLIKTPIWRIYLFAVVFGTLAFSFTTGKIQSIKVYNNQDIKCINIWNAKNPIATKNNMRLKLLGVLGDKAIVSSLNNDSIFVINQSSFEDVVITNFKN